MPEGASTAETLDVADLKRRVDRVVDDVSRNETRLLVEKDGVPVAALVPAADLDRLRRLDREREERRALLSRLREPFKDIPPDRIESEVAGLVAEVRAEPAIDQEPVAAER